MKIKTRKSVLASVALVAMIAVAAPVSAGDNERRPVPPQNDPFWTFFAAMNHPTDTGNCQTAVTDYINGLSFNNEEERQGELQEILEFCTIISSMPADIEENLTEEEVETNLFDNTTDWHHVNNLYFQKSENGSPMGRISFNQTIDFMTYRFFLFMSNFDNMVRFDNGYISLNAAMIPDMINYGATLTMYGLDFEELPDIYVSNGATMRKALEGIDLSGVAYDKETGTLTFTPSHFSSFKVVEKGTKIKIMKILSVKKKTIKYKAGKTFRLTVRGKNLYQKGSDTSCTLGFQQAEKISVGRKGNRMRCTFSMDDFKGLGTYPLTISIPGTGEVTRTNAVRIK